jgi:hypothetical protein
MTLAAGCAMVLWSAGSFIDLRDGQTWSHTKRRYSELLAARGFEMNSFGFYEVHQETHPKEFKRVVLLRGLMPTVFFTVLFGACAMGWAAQPRTSVDTLGRPSA